jgi:hypothetical protein
MLRLSCFISILLLSAPAFSDTSIYGTYKLPVEDGLNSTLTVEKAGEDSVFIEMDCQDGPPNYNSGLVEKTMLKLNGNSVRYHNVRFEGARACTIDIEFNKQGALVTQVSGYGSVCGFGMKVMCDGQFNKQ